MLVNIYAIKDELANTFGNLMLVQEKVFKRTAYWLMHEMEKADCDDKRIYLMGQYNTDTGEIIPQTPELVYNLEEEKKNDG